MLQSYLKVLPYALNSRKTEAIPDSMSQQWRMMSTGYERKVPQFTGQYCSSFVNLAKLPVLQADWPVDFKNMMQLYSLAYIESVSIRLSIRNLSANNVYYSLGVMPDSDSRAIIETIENQQDFDSGPYLDVHGAQHGVLDASQGYQNTVNLKFDVDLSKRFPPDLISTFSLYSSRGFANAAGLRAIDDLGGPTPQWFPVLNMFFRATDWDSPFPLQSSLEVNSYIDYNIVYSGLHTTTPLPALN